MGATTMAVMTVAAMAAQSYSNYQQAKAESKTMKANAEVLKNNARQARLEGAINEDRQRQANRQAISKMRNMMGEAGIGDSQTAIGSLAQDASSAEQNALDIRYKTETSANALLQQSLNYGAEAKNTNRQGRNQFYTGMLSSVIGGFGAYQKYKTPVDTEGNKKYNIK